MNKQWLSEENLINNVARIIPWLAPLIPASFAFHNARTALGLTGYEPWLIAATVEGLGISVIYTFFQLIEAMKKGKGYKPRNEAILMGIMALFYLAVVVVVNILLDLDHSPTIIAARALLSLISIPAGVTLSVRNLQTLRQEGDTRDYQIASLRGKLGSLTRRYDAALSEVETVAVERDTIAANLETATKQLSRALADLKTLQRSIDNDYVRLDILPTRLAYYTSRVSQGFTPNGDFADKFGVGVTSLDRTNSTLLSE